MRTTLASSDAEAVAGLVAGDPCLAHLAPAVGRLLDPRGQAERNRALIAAAYGALPAGQPERDVTGIVMRRLQGRGERISEKTVRKYVLAEKKREIEGNLPHGQEHVGHDAGTDTTEVPDD